MKLYGMLDSPYVRRLAIGLHLRGLTFEQLPLSVFADYPAFARINPAVKAPTLVLDDGSVLMESSVILAFLDAQSSTPLLPRDASGARLIGLALTACEKTVQIVYEHRLRPEEKRHQPWIERISEQLHATLGELEQALATGNPSLDETPDQAAIDLAVAWSFLRHMAPDQATPEQYPHLAGHTERMERSEGFRRYGLPG